MSKQRIIVLVGSASDMPFAHRIQDFLTNERLPVKCEFRISSAHRNTQKLLNDMKAYDRSGDNVIYVTVAGLSDALSALVAGNTTQPVIACPPDLKNYGWGKAFSSVVTPVGVPVALVSEPENAALTALRILAISNAEVSKALQRYNEAMREKVVKADDELQKKEKHELEREHVERVEHLEHGEHVEHSENE